MDYFMTWIEILKLNHGWWLGTEVYLKGHFSFLYLEKDSQAIRVQNPRGETVGCVDVEGAYRFIFGSDLSAVMERSFPFLACPRNGRKEGPLSGSLLAITS